MGGAAQVVWTLGSRVAALIQRRGRKINVKTLRRRHGLTGTRYLLLDIFDDSGKDVEGKNMQQFLFLLTEDSFERYDWEKVRRNPLVRPTIEARIGAFAVINFVRQKAPVMMLRNQKLLTWKYRVDHPQNHLHTDMALLVEILNEIRDEL